MREFWETLHRNWSYRHQIALSVQDILAIFVHQDESLDVLGQTEPVSLPHGHFVGQKSSKLCGYIIRKVLTRMSLAIMILQFVQHLERHHEVRQCKLVCDQHIDNHAILFSSSPHGARLDRAGYESKRAEDLPVEPLQDLPSHI